MRSGVLGSPWVSPYVWEPPRRVPDTVTAPMVFLPFETVFLPFEPAAPVLPPLAFRRFELKPEPRLFACLKFRRS